MNEWIYIYSAQSLRSSGVYAIVNVAEYRWYIGSSKDMVYRSGQHFKMLEEGIHHNRELQYSWNLYGPNVFSFVVLEYCTHSDLETVEQKWLNRLKYRAFNVQMKIKR